jgi:FkbM family methyltransferase
MKKIYRTIKEKVLKEVDPYKYSPLKVELDKSKPIIEMILEFGFRNSPIKIEIGISKPIEFYFRPSSWGDRSVIRRIFIHNDYDLTCWEQGHALLKTAKLFAVNGFSPLIIDAGANIGGATVFFDRIIQKSKIVCIEPDSGNCSVLKRNIEGTNSIILECAISSKIGQVELFDPGHGDMGFRTKEPLTKENGVLVPSISINEILDLYLDNSVPFIVKIDIEGFENDLFSSNCEWMDKFPCIIIELHDWMLPRQCPSANFLKQIASRNYDLVSRGENIFLFNMELIDEYLSSNKLSNL